MLSIKRFLGKINKDMSLAILGAIAVVVIGVLVYFNFFGASNNQIAQKAVDYINNNNLSQSEASLSGNVVEESGVVKFKIKIGSNEYDSYATKDGRLFFPEAFEMKVEENDSGSADDASDNSGATAENCDSLAKSSEPVLEAYIVSRCPFGLQMQRAMADAVKSVPALADYLKVRYMGSASSDGKTITSMHGTAEADENLRQICIREEQPAKYWDYVACQMKASGTEKSCEQSTGVDSARLSACILDASRGVAYAKEDFALDTKYSITGSPTLILGGSKVSESGFGGRSSEAIKSIICCASENQSDFCSQKLNTAAAASSFSATYSSSSSSNNSANCGQ